MNLEDARQEAQKILADWKLGIDLSKMPPVPTLSEVLECFLLERSMKLETKKTYRSLIERSMHDWLKLPVNALSKEMILSRHQQLVKPTRCGTENRACANSAMQVLRCLLNFAAAKYDLAGLANPTEALKYRWYRVEARQGVIPDAQLPKFYRAVMKQPKIARDFILLLLFTGLRRNEAAALKWANVDFANGTLTIEAESNKSNRVHTLPLTPMLTAILQSRLPSDEQEEAEPSEFVFPGRYEGHINEPRAVLAHLRAEMGWQWILHDLRRTALSAGEKAGVPFLALQKIANHVIRREVTDQYLILDSDFLRAHMETISLRLLELMKTDVYTWMAADTINVKEAHAAGLGRSAKLIELTVDEVASDKTRAINIRSGQRNILDQLVKSNESVSVLTSMSILEDEPEEIYW